jgi:predicted nucleic acid-binding protein
VIVLDTNVVSEAMRPAPDAAVMAWLRAQPLSEIATTTVTLAEIDYGLCRIPTGRRREDLEARLRTFLARGFGDRILPFDAAAAGLYGGIVTTRQATGRPIDAFDAMIAAIARSRLAAIATRNVADFEGCGVTVLDPWRT